MKKIFTSACLILLLQLTYGQSSTGAGYIINVNGDTIKGMLKILDDNNVYRRCVMVNGNEEKTYTPKDIRGYGHFNGSQYTSALKDTFCYIIGQSKFSILKAYDQFYLQTQEGKLVKLTGGKKLVYKEEVGTNVEVEDNSWRRNLKANSLDCPKMDKYIKSMQLFERQLAKFMEEYSRCAGEDVKYSYGDLPWVKTQFGFIGGASYVHLS